jgi:hypothetical protein
MKAFFTQPIGNLARQNAIGFIVCNIYLIATGFELFESIDGVNRIFNFAWGFTLLAIIIASYQLVEDQVPEYWKMATGILATVIILGTLIEISVPEFRENGFSGMYFLWSFNSLTYILTIRGTGVFRPVYEYLSIFAFTGLLIGSGAGLFFDYTPPESIQPLFGIAWISMIIGFGYGSYVAWGDKMSSSTE